MPKHKYKKNPLKNGTVLVQHQNCSSRNFFLVNIHVKYKCLIKMKVVCKTSEILCLLITLGRPCMCLFDRSKSQVTVKSS